MTSNMDDTCGTYAREIRIKWPATDQAPQLLWGKDYWLTPHSCHCHHPKGFTAPFANHLGPWNEKNGEQTNSLPSNEIPYNQSAHVADTDETALLHPARAPSHDPPSGGFIPSKTHFFKTLMPNFESASNFLVFLLLKVVKRSHGI